MSNVETKDPDAEAQDTIELSILDVKNNGTVPLIQNRAKGEESERDLWGDVMCWIR